MHRDFAGAVVAATQPFQEQHAAVNKEETKNYTLLSTFTKDKFTPESPQCRSFPEGNAILPSVYRPTYLPVSTYLPICLPTTYLPM